MTQSAISTHADIGERKMQDIQEILNTLTKDLVLAFTTLVLLDFFAGLVCGIN
jgi:hypothetical protein